mgnify:CR=1 FL=1
MYKCKLIETRKFLLYYFFSLALALILSGISVREERFSEGMMRNVSCVSFVCVAEFNIDSGSMVRHQVPCDVGYDSDLLAGYMLPEVKLVCSFSFFDFCLPTCVSFLS